MKQRLLSVLITITILLSMGIPAMAAETSFTDVAADAWYAEAVAYCRENGIMSGTSDTRFNPQGSMIRSMMATVLWNMAGRPTAIGDISFTDVRVGTWYSEAICWASQNGIISGYNSTTFGLDDPVTREQIASMLYRYESYINEQPAPVTNIIFVDAVTVSGWAQPAVAWAAGRQIVSGKPGNLFDPLAGATRAEVAMMIYRYMSNANTASAPETPSGSKILVAYFSCTGNTEKIAGWVAAETGSDVYQITPQKPYTPADLNYNNVSSRASTEQNDPSARPAISGSVENMAQYDVIYIGYPIWWGQAPKIISTFLESYDFAGKTIVPFCTSGSSGLGSSDTNLHALCTESTQWIPGERFAASDTQEAVAAWIDDLDILTSDAY